MTATQASAAQVDNARAFVNTIATQALNIISAGDGKEQKEAKLAKLFSGSVDIPWVGRFTLGRYWREATAQQQDRYLKEYDNFWVSHYAHLFAEYSGGNFKITSASEDDENQYVVAMTMTSAETQQDVQVEYHVHVDSNNQLKIYDVIVEGVSMITTQRSEFASVVSSKGLDYLIDQLASRSLEASSPKS